ncbi:MAG TPA: glycosyltransferase, partial [Planctomycetota bacterium]|nr:glycosyltransferase [Planctomycetota bacterium]
MRILIYALNFSPELSGAGKYTGELARALQRRGCDIRVVTTPPYYPAWRVGEGYSSWRYTRENDSGMEIIRCPLWVPRRPSGVLRMLHLLSFAASSFPAVLRESVSWSPDVVITIAPTIFGAPAALLAARAGGAAAFLHVQDFEIEAAFKLRLVKQGWLQRVALWMEESVLRGFDRVTTI